MNKKPMIYICRNCGKFCKGLGAAKTHLHKETDNFYKEDLKYMDDYSIRGIIGMYFKIPIQAYKIEDKALMLKIDAATSYKVTEE